MNKVEDIQFSILFHLLSCTVEIGLKFLFLCVTVTILQYWNISWRKFVPLIIILAEHPIQECTLKWIQVTVNENTPTHIPTAWIWGRVFILHNRIDKVCYSTGYTAVFSYQVLQRAITPPQKKLIIIYLMVNLKVLSSHIQSCLVAISHRQSHHSTPGKSRTSLPARARYT